MKINYDFFLFQPINLNWNIFLAIFYLLHLRTLFETYQKLSNTSRKSWGIYRLHQTSENRMILRL